MSTTETVYTKKDFMTSQDVRWCPGCGDYSILAAVQKILPELGIPKEKFVFVSGIGCSSRFPYYMNTYGFHTIHGRAPAIATGVQLMNPELSVWVITGDGDALSIGGNHLIHAIRRNLNMNILLFNNEIYGLTKGQTSPTTKLGYKTKSTPAGNVTRASRPLNLALGAEATFIARTADILGKHMQETLVHAQKHKGTSFVEILQNCHIFNDGAFKDTLEKSVRDDRVLQLEEGKPMIFGAENDKGIRLNMNTFKLEVVNLKDVPESEILVHDPHNPEPALHGMLARMNWPEYPVAMGVIRSVDVQTFDEAIEGTEKKQGSDSETSLMKLLYSGETWTIE